MFKDMNQVLLSKIQCKFNVLGVSMRSKSNFSTDSLNFAPFALLPSVFPRREFERAVEIQPIINELIHRVAHDHEFLQDCLKL